MSFIHGTNQAGNRSSIKADRIISFHEYYHPDFSTTTKGTMILYSEHGTDNDKLYTFFRQPYEEVVKMIEAAEKADKTSRYVVAMEVLTDVMNITGAAVDKWAPVIKAKLNER